MRPLPPEMVDERYDVVQFPNMPAPNWYVRITFADGRTWHSDPWLTELAAQYQRLRIAESPHGFMRHRAYD